MTLDSRFSNLAVQDEVIHSPSWGAAAFGSLFLLAMRAYSHACFVGLVIAAFAATQIYPDRLASLGWLPSAGMVAAWLAGVVWGRRLAWSARRWRDFADFAACQQQWDWWGKGALGMVAIAVGFDRGLDAVAPPRGLRAREILDAAVTVMMSAGIAITAWWYLRRRDEHLRRMQRLALRALATMSLALFVGSVRALFSSLYLPDASDFSIGAAMFAAGVVGAVLIWLTARRLAPRMWWVRLFLRGVVLLAAFVSAAGLLEILRVLRVPETLSTSAMVILVFIGVVVVAWPAVWRHPLAARSVATVPATRPAPPPGVHLRTAVEAAVIMKYRPFLVLPLLVTVVLQSEIRLPAGPKAMNLYELIGRLALLFLLAMPIHTLAVAIVAHVTVQLQRTQSISFAAALRRSLARFPAAVAANLLFLVRVFVGLLLFVVPGVVAFVRGALLPQAVILGNAGPLAAVGVSGDLLRGHWWRVLLLLCVEGVAALVLTIALGKVPYVGMYVAKALVGTWVAITLTLLYLQLGGTIWEATTQKRG